MFKLESRKPYISFVKIMRSSEPVKELEEELVSLLAGRLKELKIAWNPEAFRAALDNPELPEELLGKLEDFLGIAEPLNWSLPKTFIEALDRLIEDIESFDPEFSKSLEASRRSGRVSKEAIKSRLGL